MFRFSRILKALSLTVSLAALTLFATSCGSSSKAQARFVNALENTANYGGGADVEVNGTKVFTNVVFPNASASTYSGVPSGNDAIVGFVTGSTTNQLFSDSATLNSGSPYTVVAAGFVGGTVNFNAFADTNTAPANGNVNFRVINASPSGPAGVDIYIEQAPFGGNLTQPATITNLTYLTASSYISLPWNSNGSGWTIYVTTTGNTNPNFSFDTQNIASQTTSAIRTLVLTDVANGAGMSPNPIVLSDLN